MHETGYNRSHCELAQWSVFPRGQPRKPLYKIITWPVGNTGRLHRLSVSTTPQKGQIASRLCEELRNMFKSDKPGRKLTWMVGFIDRRTEGQKTLSPSNSHLQLISSVNEFLSYVVNHGILLTDSDRLHRSGEQQINKPNNVPNLKLIKSRFWCKCKLTIVLK